MQYDVIVIGAGASGLMAAGQAAARGRRVLLLEKNSRPGEKLAITGGGRCNITNAEADQQKLLAHYGVAKPFLHSPFSHFSVKDTFSFFESLGLPLVEQAHKRVFPRTERAVDVVRVLTDFVSRSGVRVLMRTPVERVLTERGRIKGVVAGGTEYSVDSYILATGGISHPETGSTGDGFGWLRELGHTVQAPTPTLVPLAVSDAWVKKLAGVTLKTVKVSFFVDGTRKLSVRGDVLCTHFGLSGPTVLNAAAAVSDLLHEGAVTGQIDVCPGEDIGALDARIVAVIDGNKNKSLKNIWNDFAPVGSGPSLLPMLKGIPADIKAHSITREQRRAIVDLLKGIPVHITGLMGADRAVVADGGLALDEVDTRTMRSLKCPNLFVTGDLLNISRPSGGYSLQLCWTTGYVAGQNA